MFSSSGAYRDCLRINVGHPLDARALAAVKQVGKLAKAMA
jgi:DNA-binding transcriptional MocR family regulator